MMMLDLVAFCLVSSITPGPNNMMLLSSGATFGVRRTVRHIAGISGGCALMVLVLGGMLAGVVGRLPGLFTALHLVSTVYLLWLAWRIATSAGPHAASKRARPFGALEAGAFQWVNPKAWAMVLGAVTSFARPAHLAVAVPLIAAVLVVVGMPCILLWASFGQMLRRFLSDPKMLRVFNIGMAGLLVASIAPGIWTLISAARLP
jgi:threonine/homoserine/homoserine lactone efflux protein